MAWEAARRACTNLEPALIGPTNVQANFGPDATPQADATLQDQVGSQSAKIVHTVTIRWRPLVSSVFDDIQLWVYIWPSPPVSRLGRSHCGSALPVGTGFHSFDHQELSIPPQPNCPVGSSAWSWLKLVALLKFDHLSGHSSCPSEAQLATQRTPTDCVLIARLTLGLNSHCTHSIVAACHVHLMIDLPHLYTTYW